MVTMNLKGLADATVAHVDAMILKYVKGAVPVFGDFVVYVVVDEVGSNHELITSVVENRGAEITAALVRKLTDRYGVPFGAGTCNNITVAVSLVGTGVGRSRGNSLPPHFNFCDVPAGLPEQVFRNALAKASNANSHFVDVSVAAVKGDPLLGSMLTNSRCAQFAGEELGLLIKMECTTPSSNITQAMDGTDKARPYIHDLIIQNSESIVSRVKMLHQGERVG